MGRISPTHSSNSKAKAPAQRGGFSSIRTLARPDEWAVGMELRVDGRPFSLKGREYVRDVIRDQSAEIVIPKAAQMAFTVTALTKTMHNVTERHWNGLYLLPVKIGAIPFVQARIDPIISSNDGLKEKFQSVDNRLHKQTADGKNLYIRGTNIDRELQEIPVDFEMWDERDRMVEENLEDARHRMDGSDIRKLMQLSTPTVEGHGIFSEDAWDNSDMHRWEVPCQGCGRYQVLNFEQPGLDYSNVKLGDTHEECVIECAYCNREITDEERPFLNSLGRWVATNPDGRIRGYHISQFNSPTLPLYEIMKGWFQGQRDVRKLRSFYRQNLGLPFAAPGDRITKSLLDSCRVRGMHLGGIPETSLHVGIDVGNRIHVWVWTKNRHDQLRLWQLKNFGEWGEVDKFLATLNSWTGVIDAHPEKRAARDLSIKYHGKLWVGFEQDRDQQAEIATFQQPKRGESSEVKIDRTLAFDQFITLMQNGQVQLPADAENLGENMPRKDYNGLYYQLMQMVRVEEENLKGTVIARWKKNKNPDHWHHAGMFAMVAAIQKPVLDVPMTLANAFQKGGALINAS